MERTNIVLNLLRNFNKKIKYIKLTFDGALNLVHSEQRHSIFRVYSPPKDRLAVSSYSMFQALYKQYSVPCCILTMFFFFNAFLFHYVADQCAATVSTKTRQQPPSWHYTPVKLYALYPSYSPLFWRECVVLLNIVTFGGIAHSFTHIGRKWLH